jgi:hypothetical protein
MVEKSKFKEIMLSCVDSIILSDVANIWYCKYSNNRFYTCTSNGQRDFLRVYSYPDFLLLYKYGSKGQGPGEFISVNWAKTQVEDEFILYDIMKKQLHVFISGDTVPTKINSYSLYDGDGFAGLSKPFTMINKINDSIFLMKVNLLEQITLETADLKNRKVLHTSPGSFAFTKSDVGYYDFEVEYRDSIIVSAFHNIDRIEISKIDKDYNIIKKIITGDSYVDTGQDIDDATIFYTDVKCEGNRIYALYQNENSNNSTIEVYDLEGNAIHKWLLDNYVKIFFISPDSNYLYGYHQSMESDILLKYRIN